MTWASTTKLLGSGPTYFRHHLPSFALFTDFKWFLHPGVVQTIRTFNVSLSKKTFKSFLKSVSSSWFIDSVPWSRWTPWSSWTSQSTITGFFWPWLTYSSIVSFHDKIFSRINEYSVFITFTFGDLLVHHCPCTMPLIVRIFKPCLILVSALKTFFLSIHA